MATWIPIVLAIATAVLAGVTTLLVWGFWSGKFIQKYTDDVRGLDSRVTVNEGRIREGEAAGRVYIDRVNAELGRLQHKLEMLQQRTDIGEKHGDERHERIDANLDRFGNQLNDLQRQIDLLRGGQELDGYDQPDRRRR